MPIIKGADLFVRYNQDKWIIIERGLIIKEIVLESFDPVLGFIKVISRGGKPDTRCAGLKFKGKGVEEQKISHQKTKKRKYNL